MLRMPNAQNVRILSCKSCSSCLVQFGFNFTGPADATIVVEASTDLSNPVWIPVGTNTLTGGSSFFSDPRWTNYSTRFYRLRSP